MSATKQKQRPGTGAYANGQATVFNILERAKEMVIEQGFAQLSMRGLARSLDMSPGNLSYYYGSKSDLIEDLCSYVLQPYLDEFERLRQTAPGNAPMIQLRAVIEFVFNDLAQKETTHFFPELWVLALRDDLAAAQMEKIYIAYRSVLAEIIREARPEIEEERVQDLALSISAAIEGHTVFVGHGRSHAERSGPIGELIVEQLTHMVENA